MGNGALPQPMLAKGAGRWDYPPMTVIADNKSRLQLRRWDVKPAEVWEPSRVDADHILLTKLVKPEPPPARKPRRSFLAVLRSLGPVDIAPR